MNVSPNVPPALRLPVYDPTGETRPQLAPKQVDDVEAVKPTRSAGHHRVSYLWDADLEHNVAHVVDNHTGAVVGKSVTDAQKDHALRIRKLVGQHVDEHA